MPIPTDLGYIAIFSMVLILPKILQRVRIPSGITALLIGIFVGWMDTEIKDDALIKFLAQIGITSLFVFSGFEVDFEELKEDKEYLTKYVLKYLIALLLISLGVYEYFDLTFQDALIVSLGIFTPSAGFIINSLHSFNIGENHEYWVKSKAIGKELISIILLFIALQSGNIVSLLVSFTFYLLLFLFLPPLFKLFFRFVSPYAPDSEVTFLVVLSLISGVISKELGAYYLVGAFVVGLIGSRFKGDIFKNDKEVILKSLSSFFNVFLPFYFFHTGLQISIEELSKTSIILGLSLIVLFVPLRLALIYTSLKLMLKEFVKRPYQISVSLMPTLIFGLVIAGILKEKATVPYELIYALIVYTLVSSILPTLLLSLSRKKT